MSKRSIITVSVIATFVVTVCGVAWHFHGHHLWNALLQLHGQQPH